MTTLSLATHPGPRDYLEDAAQAVDVRIVGPTEAQLGLLLLLDGVGGQAGGDVAAATARDSIVQHVIRGFALQHGESIDPEGILKMLRDALHEANSQLLSLQRANPELASMATTVVAAAVIGKKLALAWAGDSRAYMVRNGDAKRLTRDHSETEDLVMLGLISRQEAKTHRCAHVIYQHLGKADGFCPSHRLVDVQPGDTLVLCSDGLHDVVDDDAIANIVVEHGRSGQPFDALADRLVREALARFTTDNTTVLAARLIAPAPTSGGAARLSDATQVIGYETAIAEALAYLQGDHS